MAANRRKPALDRFAAGADLEEIEAEILEAMHKQAVPAMRLPLESCWGRSKSAGRPLHTSRSALRTAGSQRLMDMGGQCFGCVRRPSRR